MKDTVYLTLDSKKVKKMTWTPPSLESNQRVLCLTVNVPDSFFRIPAATAVVNVDDAHTKFDLNIIPTLERELDKLKQGATKK
jgi:hypothetical protein